MRLSLPALDPDRVAELSGLQRVQASLRLRIEEVATLKRQHEERIAGDLLAVERSRLQVAELADELAELQRVERWLAETPADSCTLCPPDGGCSFACGRATA